ncbi:hypothetical protein BDZ89DRAFT_1140028 [Hymenopellis radicata]|nr:hypothetical protein BDZ89DRAFT_1140028 [Hymenopellis radicata]
MDSIDLSAHWPESSSDDGSTWHTGEATTCLWGNCGKIYDHVPTLVQHIYRDHIGDNTQFDFPCDWATCSRRGIPSLSRSALLSHLRCHTKERPFHCPVPGCEKTFRRSDALTKHQRYKHSSFLLANPETVAPLLPHQKRTRPVDDSARDPTESWEGIPLYLHKHLDPSTNTIHGRSKGMVQYLIMKAKHRHVLQINKALNEELRVVTKMLEDVRSAKEMDLDKLVVRVFGKRGQAFLAPISLPDNGTDARFDWESDSNVEIDEGKSPGGLEELEELEEG